MSALLISVHDVAPTTVEAARRWLRFLDLRGLRSTLLVVAGPWDGNADTGRSLALAELLEERVAAGDEVSQHGWTHAASAHGPLWRRAIGRVVARGASEFWALSEAEVEQRLRDSGRVLGQLGVKADGVTPPGWMPSAAAVAAARSCGLRYITSSRAIHDLASRTRHSIPAFCQRPGSLLSGVGRTVVDRGISRRVTRGLPVRIGLHPADLDHLDLRRSSLRAIDSALRAGNKATTYMAYLEEAS